MNRNKTLNSIRVRFAPSPTGHLHIGGARTALFNWLYARRTGGTYLLRVEDSDRKRSEAGMTEEIFRELIWLGLDWDEGPYFQSERGELYQQQAAVLLQSGRAYQAPPAESGGRAVIYRVEPDEEIVFYDLIRGRIATSTREIKDIVLIKSDGSPAYNFACAVDDHDLEISHVIRGEDHIPNTPKQLILYRAFGWKPPKFVHLPLILGEDQAPLSKRHGATSISAFRKAGYLPDTLVNYLALLGWSPGDDTEFLPPPELIKRFSLKRVIKRAAVFDYRKLNWLNGKYLRLLPRESLVELARPVAREAWGEEKVSDEKLKAVISLLGARLKTVRDLVAQGDYFFQDEINYQPEAVEKYWSDPSASEFLREAKDALAELPAFDRSSLEKAFTEIIERRGIKAGELFHPLRVALTGRADSPGVFEILLLLGKETSLRRLDASLNYLQGRTN